MENAEHFSSYDKCNIERRRWKELRNAWHTFLSRPEVGKQIIRLSLFVVIRIIPSVNRSKCIPALRSSSRVFSSLYYARARANIIISSAFSLFRRWPRIAEESPVESENIGWTERRARCTRRVSLDGLHFAQRSLKVHIANGNSRSPEHERERTLEIRNLNHLFRYIPHSSPD